MADQEGDSAEGGLFRNIRFFIAQRVPMRQHFIEQVRANGGGVVPLEKHADIIIADHMRPEAPAGSYSYTWIEESLKHGELQDKEAHRAGHALGYIRPVGSLRPAKAGGRNPYTAEDDRILYEWVSHHERNGGRTSGNEIYKQLEQQNSRHPWQSWRDRWVRYVSQRPPRPTPRAATPLSDTQQASDPRLPRTTTETVSQPTMISRRGQQRVGSSSNAVQALTETTVVVTGSAASGEVDETGILDNNFEAVEDEIRISKEIVTSPTYTSEALAVTSTRLLRNSWGQRPSVGVDAGWLTTMDGQFTDEEHELLLDQAPQIQNIPVGKYREAWIAWAILNPQHSVDDWVNFYEFRILPEYEQLREMHPRQTDAVNTSNGMTDNGLVPANTDAAIRKTPPPQEHNRHEVTSSGGQSSANAVEQTPTQKPVPVVVVESPTAFIKSRYTDPTEITDLTVRPFGHSPKRKRRKLENEVEVMPVKTPEHIHRQSAEQTQIPSVPRDVQGASMALSEVLQSAAVQLPSRKVVLIDLLDETANEDDNISSNRITEADLMNVIELDPAIDQGGEFQVYESNELPEGDEENVGLDVNGTTTTTRRHIRERSREALAPLPVDFKLVDSPQASQDIWHDISDIEERASDYVDAENHPIIDEVTHSLLGWLPRRRKTGENVGLGNEVDSDSEEERTPTPKQDNHLNGPMVQERDRERPILKIDKFEASNDDEIDIEYESARPNHYRIADSQRFQEFEIDNENNQHIARAGTPEMLENADADDDVDEVEMQDSGLPFQEDLDHEDENALYQDDAADAIAAQISRESVSIDEAVTLVPRSRLVTELDSLSRRSSLLSAIVDVPGVSNADNILRNVDANLNQLLNWDMIEGEHDRSSAAEEKREAPNAVGEHQPKAYVENEEYNAMEDIFEMEIAEKVEDVDGAGRVEGMEEPQYLEQARNAVRLGNDPNGLDEIESAPSRWVEQQPKMQRQLDTQAILDSELTELDLEIPPAPDDFYEGEYEPIETSPIEFLPADTQAIINAHTQQLDLDIPVQLEDDLEEALPSDSSAASNNELPVNGNATYELHSSPPPVPSTASKRKRYQDTELLFDPFPRHDDDEVQDIEEKFYQRQIVLGSNENDINFALFQTCLDLELADVALDAMRQGKGLPSDIPGIWTEEDDRVLDGVDAVAMRRMEAKHGKEAYDQRWEMRNAYREAQI